MSGEMDVKVKENMNGQLPSDLLKDIEYIQVDNCITLLFQVLIWVMMWENG